MNDQDSEYLELESLQAKSRLVALLPTDIARRYHALPVSREGKKITVVMADPNDLEGRQAVVNSLGPSTYFVKADVHTIDHSLDVLLSEPTHQPPKILIWTPSEKTCSEINAYTKEMARLLAYGVRQFHDPPGSKQPYQELSNQVKSLSPQLVIFEIPESSTLQRLFPQHKWRSLLDRLPVSLMVARNPRWPLKKVLLIIRNDETDDAAIDWSVLLARRSGASITILPILPPVPLMYSGLTQMRYNLPALLTTNCPLGRKMRQLFQRLDDWGIKGTLRLRDESPDWQIRAEIAEGDYDLIIISCEPNKRWWQCVLGEFFYSLLDWAEQPVLVAKLSPVT